MTVSQKRQARSTALAQMAADARGEMMRGRTMIRPAPPGVDYQATVGVSRDPNGVNGRLGIQLYDGAGRPLPHSYLPAQYRHEGDEQCPSPHCRGIRSYAGQLADRLRCLGWQVYLL